MDKSTNAEPETTAMAEEFLKAAQQQTGIDAPQERVFAMAQWPNIQTERDGVAVTSTAVVLPLSNEEIIQRIERTAARADIENGESQNQLDEVIVSSFIESYLRPLAAATREEVTRRNDGAIVLPRRTIKVNDLYVSAISYGYNPAEVAFALKQLYDLLTKAKQGADRKKLHLSKDVLLGFSCMLGYYNLYSYLVHTKLDHKDNRFLHSLCDLTVLSSDVQGLANDLGAASWFKNHLPPEGNVPHSPCNYTFNGTRRTNMYSDELTQAYRSEEDRGAAEAIFELEKQNLLAFRKSLYMYLTVVAPPAQYETTREGSATD